MRFRGGLWAVAWMVGCTGRPSAAPVQVVVRDAPDVARVSVAPRTAMQGSPAEPLFEAEVALRARAAYHGSVYAQPPGRGVVPLNPEHVRRAAEPGIFPWDVVETRDASLRVRIQHQDATLIVYVPREDLVVVARHTTRVALSSDDEGGDDGVFVRSGTALAGERRRGRVQVRVQDAGVTVMGTVPTTAVGQAYTPDERQPSYERDLLSGTMVRRADGRPLFSSGTEPWPVEVVDERDGESKIVFLGEQIEVRGWVDSTAVVPARTRGFGTSGCRRAVAFRAGHPRVLHFGDRLRAPDTRAVYGLVGRYRLPVTDAGGQGKGRRVQLHLAPHGRFEAWIDENDLTFGERFEAAFRNQVQMTSASKVKLPSSLLERKARLVGCVELARAEGRTKPIVRQLSWDGERIDVPPRGLRASLRDCIQSELAEIENPPAQPLPFTLRLDPRPLPTRQDTVN